MTWQCIAEGANGIVYFKYGDLHRNEFGDSSFEKRWADVVAIAQEVKNFMPVLLSDERAPEVTVLTGGFCGRAFCRLGKTYLVLVNTSTKAGEVKLNVGGAVGGEG